MLSTNRCRWSRRTSRAAVLVAVGCWVATSAEALPSARNGYVDLPSVSLPEVATSVLAAARAAGETVVLLQRVQIAGEQPVP